jgi:hypothetical protein
LPNIQNVYQIEHSILNNDNVIKQSPGQSFNTSSQHSDCGGNNFVQHVNSIDGDKNQGENPIEQGVTRKLRLQRLAKDLVDVFSGPLELDNSNINKMSNLEKTIWEVSRSNFDVSQYFSCPCSETFSFEKSKIKKNN